MSRPSAGLWPRMRVSFALAIALVSGMGAVTRAQESAGAPRGAPVNPPPPVAPEVLARDESGQRATVRALKVREPLRIDGRLDEALYRERAVEGFIQTLPNEGAPASERTEAWLAFDDRFLYVACRCWDSEPPAKWVANEMRRD